MAYRPKKSYGAWLGLIMGVIIFTFILWGIDFSLDDGDKVLKILLFIPAYLFLFIYVYVLIGAFNIKYKVEDDTFTMVWGFMKKRVAWDQITDIIMIKGNANLSPFIGVSWPGYLVGLYSIPGLGPVRMLGTDFKENFIYIKSEKGFFGISPEDDRLLELLLEKSGKKLELIDMNEMPYEIKGKSMQEDRFFQLYYKLNVIFLLLFVVYIGIFFPGSNAPNFIILLLVLAVTLFYFNLANAKRLFQYSHQGSYVALIIALAVTGVFLILSIAEISL